MNTETPENGHGVFHESNREPGEDNVQWVSRHLHALADSLGELLDGDQEYPEDPTVVLLLGGRTPSDFRIRVAQSPFRHDVTPSHWSHAAIIKATNEDPRRTVLLESSLEPARGFGMPLAWNGLQTNYLEWYESPDRYPNLALLQVPVSRSRWEVTSTPLQTGPLEQFAKHRQFLDVPGLILRWLGYVWSVGDGANPLLQGFGLPAAAAVEALLDGEGYDICAGLESGASSPEAMWQAAKWWHPYYASYDTEPIHGYFTRPDRLDYTPTQYEPGPPDLWLEDLSVGPEARGVAIM
jgi:hypothetical protein